MEFSPDTRSVDNRAFWLCYIGKAPNRQYIGYHICDDYGNLVPVTINRASLTEGNH